METLPPLPVDFNVPEEGPSFERTPLRGTVMLVGATDTGKSTLARWLIEKSLSHGRTSAWLDADPGQTSLGIPGTLNVVIASRDLADAVVRASFFVGSSSPRGHMLQVLAGLCRLRDYARSKGAALVFVDTSGLIAEEPGGSALKEWKVELLAPTGIVALQRGLELEHLLAPWRHDHRFRLHLLPVAAGARLRSFPQSQS